ncbi:hypothetical protein O6H91_01G161700 [Diphasiastrum complanatum]|uniref:Uncharacterized protein n=2 Tax=Diphasiastrum complanatum TaxID=34168 RepID=A0ACC2EY93_DIPCM|nr:hypothetical protein O6H91_01G161700 [Diphasiastrum complanatum]KAJ7571387.1 hypothetical protein O6H91_01G161700 [Diphasiastrum complanatum]
MKHIRVHSSLCNAFPQITSPISSAHLSSSCCMGIRSNVFCISYKGVRSDATQSRNMIIARYSEESRQTQIQDWMHATDPYKVLGLTRGCDQEQVKAAFRNRVKEYHPDVYKGTENAAAITRRLIGAYEKLISDMEEEILESGTSDPFEEPECVAEDVFVNEFLCVGRGCRYSCVARAPQVFNFAADTSCARAVSQVETSEYHVQLAVGQCPRNCIYYVTPAQRMVLEDLLRRALEGTIYSSEVAMLEVLIARANFENGRFMPSKRKPKQSSEMVDWF